MTNEDFDKWREDFGRHFPSVVSWFKNLPTETQDAQRELWRKVLADVSLRDALAANWRIYNGDEEAIGTTNAERERSATYVRRVAVKIRAEREAKSSKSPARDVYLPRQATSGDPKSGAYGTFKSLVDNGVDLKDAVEQAFGGARGREISYRCPQCRDSGSVEVWSPRSMLAYLEGVLDDRANWRYVVAACDCPQGDALVGDGPKYLFERSQQYHPDVYCLCPYADVAKEIDSFRSWCAAYFEKRQEERDRRLGTSTFNEWNNGGGDDVSDQPDLF